MNKKSDEQADKSICRSKVDVEMAYDVRIPSLFDIANNEFLTTEEVALYLRTTVGAIRTATCNGRIPPNCYRKFGKRNLYFKSEIRKLLTGHTQNGVFNGR